MFKNKQIGIFITGGIASYKIAELVRLFIKEGALVRVAMTQSAKAFITPLTLQVLSKHEVLIDTFDETHPEIVQHIHMADWCDYAVLAPATANIIGKLANGIADDIVSTVMCALHCPTIIVPAMNENMYWNKATQRNLAQLKQDDYIIMEPEIGFLAEGYTGKGRMPQPQTILNFAKSLWCNNEPPKLLQGKTVMITAGGTKERIDPVRYISNDSSGKMGYAIAEAAAKLGATVHLISTVPNLDVPEGAVVYYVESANEMYEEVMRLYHSVDVVVMSAAVSDYYVEKPYTQKRKKQSDETKWTLVLKENPDILKTLGQQKTHQLLIGFAAETENLETYAKTKLQKKGADWIVANDVSKKDIGFNSSHNQVTLFSKENHQIALPLTTKIELAYLIWQTILENSASFSNE